MICLLPDKIEDFKKALITRKINIADLLNMETDARINVLKEYAGENAVEVNKLFEQKLILKNRELGIKNALKKITETGKYSPAEKARLEAIKSEWKAAQQERIFSPKENEAFLNSLADKITGTEITREESKTLFDLDRKTNEAFKEYNPEIQQWSSEEARVRAGAQKVAYEKYYEYLKNPEKTIKELASERGQKFLDEYKDHPARAVLDALLDGVTTITDNMIATVASLDNSFMGRQGLRTLYTHPSAWYNGAKNSFKDIVKTLGGQNTINALMADIYTRPNYINGEYHKSGILNLAEEQYPTNLPERIPVLGRAFKASEAAFKGSSIRMRTDLYDLIKTIGENQGVNFSDIKEVEAIGEMINSLTAKGKIDPNTAKGLKALGLWAPRMLKSHIDVLFDPLLAKSSFARKQAAFNLIKIVGSMATIMLIANALKPGSAETNPTSSDFGKIKVGNTRFDFTGGMASLAILAARLYKNQTKSTSTGKITKFGTSIVDKNRLQTFLDFFMNKTTPPVGVIIDYAKGLDRDFETPTVGKELLRVTTPIAFQNALKLKDNASADAITGVLFDTIGVSSSTYEPLKKKK